MLTAPFLYHLHTASETRELDRYTIEDFGIDGITLMELAGTQAAQDINEYVQAGWKGIFLCGKGNNAGDALVVARYLIQRAIDVELVFVGGTDKLSAETQQNHALLQKVSKAEASGSLAIYRNWQSFQEQFTSKLFQPDFIVDGMLGTGLNSNLRGDYTKAVEWANAQESPTFSMDIPTGLHADEGRIMGDSIIASKTYTFGARKTGLYLNEAKTQTGNIELCELPFPIGARPSRADYLIDQRWFPRNHPSENVRPSHKYEAGVLYVIAGSAGLTGAASMAALSAWKEGLGGVILVTPRGLLPYYGDALMQIIKYPIGNAEDTCFSPEHTGEIIETVTERPGTVLLGPGLGREQSTRSFVDRFLRNFEGDVLIDADGLDALSRLGLSHSDRPPKSQWMLTPHPGELARLSDDPSGSVRDDADRLKLARQLAGDLDINVLSKGNPVMLVEANGRTGFTNYDTTAYNRAGFGDVLAGKIAAHWTRTADPVFSAIRGLLRGEEIRKNKASQTSRDYQALEPFDFL